ncbi:hypothetical protein DRQ09_10175, partial [candidate division KSB1 bacterium]
TELLNTDSGSTKDVFWVKCKINFLYFLFKRGIFKKVGVILKDPATIERCRIFLSTLKGVLSFLKFDFAEANDISRIKELSEKSDCIVISPLCVQEVTPLIRDQSKIVSLGNFIEENSIQKLKITLLLISGI